MKTKINMVAGLIGLSLLLFTAEINAQSIQVSLPDTTGNPGQVLEIPLRVTTLETSDAVTSGEFTLNFNGNIIEVLSVKTEGSLLEGNPNVWYNNTSRKLAFAGQSPVTGEGTLVYLNVRVRANATKNSQTTIQFSSAMLNEGSPAVTVQNGNLRVKGINITPSFLNYSIVGDTIQFNATGDVSGSLTWDLSNNTAAEIGSNGKFVGLAPGYVRVRVTDSQGLRDSTNMFRVQPSTFTTLQVSTPDTSYQQTRIVRVPVRTTSLDDLQISSYQGRVRFNQNHFQYVGIDVIGTLTEGLAEPVTFAQNDRVTLAAGSVSHFSGSGVLIYVKLQVSQSYSGSSTIFIEDFTFNEDITPSTKNGAIQVTAAPVITISPGTLHITKGKTRQFNVSGAGTAPYTWESNDPVVASIDNDGLLTANVRGTTVVKALDANNFPSQLVTVTVNDVDVWLPDLNLTYPDTIEVPLYIEDITGLGIYSFESRIRIDTNVVDFVGAENIGTISDGIFLDVNRFLDEIRIGGASTSPLSGSGTLIKLILSAKPGVPHAATSDLIFTRMRFNEISISTPTATVLDGSLQVFLPDADEPEFSPVQGTFIGEVEVTITTPTEGGSVFYTTDGATPTSASTLYTGPVTITAPDSIKFRAITVASDYNNSGVAEATYVVNLPPVAQAPEFNPASGSYFGTVDVTLTSGTPAADIYYTTDGSVPTTSSSLYSAPIELTAPDSLTIRTIAVATGFQDSPVSSGSYLVLEFVLVWPGDTDNDGHVDQNDILPIGQYFGLTGPARDPALSDWEGKIALPWLPALAVYADADGNGTVGNADVQPVTDNFGLSWSAGKAPVTQSEPFATIILPPASENEKFIIDINLGSVVSPVTDLLGFAIHFDLFSDDIRITETFSTELFSLVDLLTFMLEQNNDRELRFAVSRIRPSGGVTSTGTLYSFEISVNKTYTNPIEIQVMDFSFSTMETLYRNPEGLGFEYHISKVVTIENNDSSIPDRIMLEQNFPNPFNPSTNIRYALPESGYVRLSVYNMIGQLIAELYNGDQAAGVHTIPFDASRLSSGIYLYQMETGDVKITRKMLLVK